jgi:hypothetical protein
MPKQSLREDPPASTACPACDELRLAEGWQSQEMTNSAFRNSPIKN